MNINQSYYSFNKNSWKYTQAIRPLCYYYLALNILQE